MQTLIRKLLRRPGQPQVVQLGMAIEEEAAGSSSMVSWGPPPDPATDLAAYAADVTRRIANLHEMVQDVKHELAAETEARQAAISDAQAALTTEIDEVRALSRQVAVGGLRKQAAGWAFLFAGLILSAIGSAVG